MGVGGREAVQRAVELPASWKSDEEEGGEGREERKGKRGSTLT